VVLYTPWLSGHHGDQKFSPVSRFIARLKSENHFNKSKISLKMNRRSIQLSILLILVLFIYVPLSYSQQNSTESLSLSIGASAGYAPVLTFGNIEDSGAILGLSGDLQYQNIIGQLDLVYVIPETVSSESLTSGLGFFGSLGYKIIANENLHIPVMLTGGASIIRYSVFNEFYDVSPQFGLTLSPYYMLNEKMSVFGAFRYMKGFKGSAQSDPIDVASVSIGLRFTLF
jgi:hypothetical protein